MNLSPLSLEQAQAYLKGSLEDLERHYLGPLGGKAVAPPVSAELRHATEEAVLHCQLWWTGVSSAITDAWLWDVFNVGIPPEMTAAECLRRLGQLVPLSDENILDKFRHPAPHVPLFKYEPIRYRALIPYAKQLAHLGADSLVPCFTRAALEEVGRLVSSYQDPESGPLRPRVLHPEPRAVSIDPVQLGLFFAEFNRTGRQLFVLPPHLVDLFAQTDVDDLPFDSLNLPYEGFYLHFGSRPDLEVAPGWHADGAYVSAFGEGENRIVQMCLTSVPSDVMTYALYFSYPEPIYIQALTARQCKIGVGLAAEMDFAEKRKELLDQQHAKSLLDEVDVTALRAELQRPALKLSDVRAASASAQLKGLPMKYEAWQKALRLIINGIAYITAYPDDIETQWPAETPPKLLQKLHHGRPSERRRARSTLAQLGFTEIHLGGRRSEQTLRSAAESVHDGRLTWVQGHWVNQPHGPRHQLRRLQWRMPHRRILSTGSPTDDTGHLYLVE